MVANSTLRYFPYSLGSVNFPSNGTSQVSAVLAPYSTMCVCAGSKQRHIYWFYRGVAKILGPK